VQRAARLNEKHDREWRLPFHVISITLVYTRVNSLRLGLMRGLRRACADIWTRTVLMAARSTKVRWLYQCSALSNLFGSARGNKRPFSLKGVYEGSPFGHSRNILYEVPAPFQQ